MSFRKRAYIIALAFVCSTTLFFPTDIYANSVNIGTSDIGIGTSNTENDLSVKINAKVITSVNGAVKHLKIEMPSDELLFGFKLTINYDSSALELIGDVTSKLLSDENVQDDGVIISTGTNYNLVEECNYILEADFRVLNQDYEDFSINFDEFYEVVGVQEFETRDVSLNTIYETEKDYILGDVNLDGKVNVMDTVAILQYSQGQIQHFGKASTKEYDLNHDGLEKTLEDDLWVADTNTDGTINVMDAVAILQYSSGTITELSRKETIISKILDVNGNPLADVKVNVINNDTNKLIKTTTSDENGDFNLGLKEGDYTLTFSKDDYITIIKSVIIDGYDNTPPLDDTIIMNIGNNIETALIGSVLDINDNLISGATVDIQKDNEVISSTTTNENGTFEIALYSGVYSLVVSKDGYQTNTIKIILDGSNESITLEPIVLNEIIQDDTGSCGENATYSFDSQTGTLTITGTGDMQDYSDNLEEIPWYSYKESIKKIVIEDGVISIGDNAFDSCTSLTEVTIPDSVTSIGGSAFHLCTSLAEVTIPDSVAKIETWAFAYCENLTSVNIPDSVTYVGWRAFDGTIFLENLVNQSEDFVIIGKSLYDYIGNDTNVTIPSGITFIGDYSFAGTDDGLNNIENLIIQDGAIEIGYQAFQSRDTLKTITIPSSLKYIDFEAFCDCTNLTDIYFDGTKEQWNAITIADGNDLLTNATIHFEKEPTTITGKVVDTEGNPISNVNIKVDLDTVTSTDENGEFSFDILNGEYTLSFEKNGYVTFSKSVSIDSNDETSPLDDTIIMDKEVIGTAYLCYSGAVQQWNIGDLGGSYATITGNGDYTASIDFAEDQGSEKIELLFIQSDINIYEEDAKGNKLYDDMVFTINSIIVDGKEIEYTGPSDEAESTSDDGNNYRFNIFNTWGNNVQDIDPNIKHTNNITVNFSVSGIKNDYSGSCGENATYSFDDTTGTLTIKGTGSIDNTPWYDVDYQQNIKNVIIEDGITSIGDWAFSGFTSLKEINIPDSVLEIGIMAFDSCTSLENVKLSNNLIYIGSGAFLGCSSLKEINIPSSVMVISNCALEQECSMGYDRNEYTMPEKIEDFTIYGVKGSIAELYATQHDFKFIEVDGELPTSGICGDGFGLDEIDNHWNFDKSTGTLTVDVDFFYYMHSNSYRGRYPWYSFKSDIKNIEIIGNENLEELDIASTCFEDYTSLESITIPDIVIYIEEGAFNGCNNLTDVYLTDMLEVEWNSTIIYNDNEPLLNATIHFTDDENTIVTGSCGDDATYSYDRNTGTLTIRGTGSVDCTNDIFYMYSNIIKTVIIEDGITSIDGYLGGTALTEVTIPNSVTEIQSYVFTGCYNLTDVYFDGTQEEWNTISIANGNAYLINALNIHLTDTVIENNILTEITENITYSLDRKTGTLTITGTGNMNNNVYTYFHDYAQIIKTIVIEDGITSIGECAFGSSANGGDFTSLTKVTIPDSVTSINIQSFYDCDNLTDVYFQGTEEQWNAITIADGNDLLTNATIHFEEEIKTPEVQTILDTAELTPHDTIYCYDCSSDMNSTDIMYTYKINDNDKQILQNFIDENFTDDMCNTEKIKYTMDWLHNNITYTLSEDYGTLSNSLAECGFVQNAGQCLQYNGALAYMLAYMGYDTNLIFLKKDTGWQHFTCQVRIDGKVYRMEVGNKGLDDGSHYMYKQFLDLEPDVNVDDNTIIGQLGEGLIGRNSTYSFNKITGTLTISGFGDIYCDSDNYWQSYDKETDKIIDFSKDIKTVIIEDGITSIYYNAFFNCVSLESITIPESVTFIGDNIFGYCTSFKNISVDINNKKYTDIDGVLFNKDITELIGYPSGKTETSYIVPDGVTFINVCAFEGCTSLKEVTVPNSVTEIAESAFYDCTSLTDVYFQGTEEEWNAIEIASYGNDSLTNATIHFKEETTNISGKVLDTEGNPISNVNIKVDLDTVTSTDENGEFSFDILNGEYTLSFEKDGYKATSQSLEVNSNSNLSLDSVTLEVIPTINGIPEDEYYQKVNEVIALVNEYRKSNGLSEMYTSSVMNELAQQRAKEQETTGLSHTRPDGSSCFTIFGENGLSYSSVAENVAYGSSTAEGVMEQWKNSSGHNANILGNYDYIGVGVTYYNNVYYWVQIFCCTSNQEITSNAIVITTDSKTT